MQKVDIWELVLTFDLRYKKNVCCDRYSSSQETYSFVEWIGERLGP